MKSFFFAARTNFITSFVFTKNNIFKTYSMFTIEQIKAAHSKVKSGADFPSYIREIKQLGVTGYEVSVSDEAPFTAEKMITKLRLRRNTKKCQSPWKQMPRSLLPTWRHTSRVKPITWLFVPTAPNRASKNGWFNSIKWLVPTTTLPEKKY